MRFKIKTPIAKGHAHTSSLEVSWREGLASVIMITITDYYLIPFGLLLGASASQIGLLVAIPHFFGSIAQLLSVRLLKRIGSRKHFLVIGTRLQTAILVPAAFLSLVSFPYRIEVYIFLVVLFRIVGNWIGTVWGSLMSDYLSPEERGIYLGWRSRITTVVGVVAMIAGGCLLYFFKKFSPEIGFLVLLLLTALSRFIASFYMMQLEDLPLVKKEGSDFTFIQFIRRVRESNFVKFVLYVSFITFATHLSAPYFSVYMLKELKLNYLTYTSVHLMSVLGGILAFPLWGKHADSVGNAAILKTTSFLVPLFPFLWTLTTYVPFLFVIEFFAGFVWAGFNLCSVNFIFDAVSPDKRVRCLSYFNLINGIGLFLGAGLGGFLADHMPPVRGSHLLFLFYLSAVLRFFAHFLLSGKFKEVRYSARKISSSELFFSVVGLRPFTGRNKELPAYLPDTEKPETK